MTDWIDQAQEVQERMRELSVRTAQQSAAALSAERLSNVCDDCPEPIEPERLAVCPGARRCLRCQEAHERFRRLHAR